MQLQLTHVLLSLAASVTVVVALLPEVNFTCSSTKFGGCCNPLDPPSEGQTCTFRFPLLVSHFTCSEALGYYAGVGFYATVLHTANEYACVNTTDPTELGGSPGCCYLAGWVVRKKK